MLDLDISKDKLIEVMMKIIKRFEISIIKNKNNNLNQFSLKEKLKKLKK
ncbi:hypothetical protein [Borreliella valaisiana]|nr:hypothetical protein KJD09_05900 [Borreliella valaisiana]